MKADSMMTRFGAAFLVALFALLSAGWAAAEIPAEDRCSVCHAEEEDGEVDVGQFHAVDVHARAGLSCVDCHGGDSTTDDEDAAMDEDAGFVGAPGALDTPEFCGRCHADPEYMRTFNPAIPVDQLSQYLSSGHGLRNREGDPRVATCADCHGVHEMRAPSEPKSRVHPQRIASTCGECHSDAKLMERYALPADQVELYEGSVHGRLVVEGKDLSAPTCNDCHGDHGALPPNVASIHAICGNCHVFNRDLYASSVKRSIFEDIEEHGCVTCHGNHGVQTTGDFCIGLAEGAFCVECHEDDGSDESEKILSMRALLDTLNHAVEETHGLIEEAEQKGMYVTDLEFLWNDVRQKQFHARTGIHMFDPDSLGVLVSDGLALADSVRAGGTESLEEFRFRRKGLLIATLLITVLGISLYFRIRSLDE